MTAYCSANGQLVTKATITIPYYGLWTADLLLPSPLSTLVDGSQVQLSLANLTMLGTAYRVDSFAGAQLARVVGGYGGWGKQVPAQPYENPSGVLASTMIADVAALVGEQAVLAQDSNLGAFYERSAGYASDVLRELSGGLWWVAPSGVTQCGVPRAGQPIVTQFVLHDFDPAIGLMTVATEYAADWLPGRTVQTSVLTTPRTLSLVTHHLGDELLTEALAV
jgi:hypothetical protein